MQLAIVKDLKHCFGERLLLDIEKFEIVDGQRIGLVGENGVGKSTLIKILIGEIKADEGKVSLTDSYSYISQREEAVCKCNDGKIKRMFHVPDEYEEFLSGGEKVKIRIVKALEENKSLLIADEPTSNLDSDSVKCLIKCFNKYKGSLLIVSHDRDFLDNVCNEIVDLEDGKLKIYKGNYTDYIKLKEENCKKEERQYKKFIHEKSRLEKVIYQKEVLRDGIKKAPKGMGLSEAKTIKMGDQRGKKHIDNNIKSIKNRIEHLEVKDKPREREKIIINIADGMEVTSKNPIEIKGLKLYVRDKVLIDEVNLSIKRNKRIAIIGENGSGKTTLLKKIIEGDSEFIKISRCVNIGYFDQHQNILNDKKSILENIKEDSSFDETFIRINLGEFGFKEDMVYKIVEDLSGGERVKVAICKIILANNNLIILDEPTNYLDVKAIEALESALINTNKTVILVSHDIRFISNVCNYIIEIKNKSIIEFDGTYSSYLEMKTNGIRTSEKKHDDELLVLKNRLSEVISLLSIEQDETKKKRLDIEYKEILKNIKMVE